jgi:hypothetical protein
MQDNSISTWLLPPSSNIDPPTAHSDNGDFSSTGTSESLLIAFQKMYCRVNL